MQTNPGGNQSRFRLSYPWLVVAMLWWISFFNYADRQAIFSVFKPISEQIPMGLVEKGWLGSSFAWVYGLSAPFAGTIVDRFRRKTAILGGLYVWSVICMATAFAQNLTQLLLFRGAEALGETFYYPASNSLISDYHGRKTRSRALGMHQTSVYAGTIAGAGFGGLIGQYYGWRMSFIVFGFLGILLGFVLQKLLIEPQRGAADLDLDCEPPHRMPVVQVLKLIATTPTLIILMLAFMCAHFVSMVLLSWMPEFLRVKFNLDLGEAGFLATLFPQCASLLGAFIGGWLADWLRLRTYGGRMLVQALGVLGGAPFVFLTGHAPLVSWLVMGLTGWGLFKGLYDANIFASAFDIVPPEARGTMAGLMNMFGWLCGGAPAPIVVAYIAESFDLSVAIASTAIVYIAAGILLIAGATAFVKRDSMRMGPREPLAPASA